MKRSTVFLENSVHKVNILNSKKQNMSGQGCL